MKTCLVVDDSKVIRKVARHILEQLNFAVDEAAVVLVDGRGEGRGAARVGGVGLDAAEQRGQRLPRGLLRGALVHAEARREIGEGDVREDVVDGTHGSDASPRHGLGHSQLRNAPRSRAHDEGPER